MHYGEYHRDLPAEQERRGNPWYFSCCVNGHFQHFHHHLRSLTGGTTCR